MLRANDSQALMAQAVQSGIPKGIVKRWPWYTFEASLDDYSAMLTHELHSDLAWCHARGLRLIVMIEHRTFGYADNVPQPPYLNSRTGLVPQQGDMIADGYTIAIWDPFVVTRFKLLLTQFASQFGSHPALEAVTLEESALGIPVADLLDPTSVGKLWQPYTPEAYRDAYIQYMAHWKTLQPDVRWLAYFNFMAQNNSGSYLDQVIQAADNSIVSGPDAQELDGTLQTRTFHLYRNNKDTRPVATFASSRVFNTAATGAEIYDFCINDLGANYMMWQFYASASHPNWVDKALPQMQAHPTFNVEDWSTP
jgi:hypothetical protein